MIIGPGSAAWEVIRDLVNHLPIMITPRWVYSKSTPIALEMQAGAAIPVDTSLFPAAATDGMPMARAESIAVS